MTRDLRTLIGDLLLTASADTLEAIAFGSLSRNAGDAADQLAGQILDLIARRLPIPTPTQSLPNAAIVDDHIVTSRTIDAGIGDIRIVDTIPLPHNLTPDLNTDLTHLCAVAGLTYHDIAFRENQPVVIATDPDGVREYYTLTILHRAAAARAETAQLGFDPARRCNGDTGDFLLSSAQGRPDTPALGLAVRQQRTGPDRRPGRPPGA